LVINSATHTMRLLGRVGTEIVLFLISVWWLFLGLLFSDRWQYDWL